MIEPKNVTVLAKNDLCAQAIAIEGSDIVGVQFHPDFHASVDESNGRKVGGMEHYYKEDRLNSQSLLRKLWMEAKRSATGRPIINPSNEAEIYKQNTDILFNFIAHCFRHI